MKSPLLSVGILFIVLGILGVTYQSFTYPKEEKVAEIGNLKITANTDKTVQIPPYVGGLSVIIGLVMVVISRKR